LPEFVETRNPLTGMQFKTQMALIYIRCSVLLMIRINKQLPSMCFWLGMDKTTEFGKSHQTSWWTDYKTKLALWATQFKDQERCMD
jgi:hypothetical protein